MAQVRRRFDFEQRSYQRYITRMCHKHGRVLIAVDMSLGKTCAVGTYVEEIWNDEIADKILIIAPLEVAKSTWPTEFRLWRHLKHLKFSVIVGTPEQRMRALRSNAPVHIINQENVQWLWEQLRNGKDFKYDTLIVDESTMLKQGKKRTKRSDGKRPMSRFGIVAKMSMIVERIILMTGTPCPEGIHNMWGQMYVIDGGERLGDTKDAFERRWINKGYMGYGTEPFPHAEKEIIALCKDKVVSLRAEDHIKLPPVITTPSTDIWVDLPPKIMAQYKAFERDMYSEEYDVEAITEATLRNKLLQFANGSMYKTDKTAVHIHDCKLNALEDFLDRLGGHHSLIATSYRFDEAAIKKRFGKKVHFFKETKDALKKWNDGSIQYLATHPKSLSHGTNLQFGGWNAVWYGLIDSGETYEQFNMRLPRPGQPHSHVAIHHILARGTKDASVLDSKEFKAARQKAMRAAARVTREDVDREVKRRL